MKYKERISNHDKKKHEETIVEVGMLLIPKLPISGVWDILGHSCLFWVFDPVHDKKFAADMTVQPCTSPKSTEYPVTSVTA